MNITEKTIGSRQYRWNAPKISQNMNKMSLQINKRVQNRDHKYSEIRQLTESETNIKINSWCSSELKT